VDLGMSPLANSLLTAEQASAMEPFYPLHARVCAKCFLVQLEEFESPVNIFSDYLYFSSYSDAWLAHCSRYAEKMIETLRLGAQSKVVEIASNDGYLLHFLPSMVFRCWELSPPGTSRAWQSRREYPPRWRSSDRKQRPA